MKTTLYQIKEWSSYFIFNPQIKHKTSLEFSKSKTSLEGILKFILKIQTRAEKTGTSL